MVVVICADEAKEVSSREAMKRTVETSPFYEAWARTAEEDLAQARSSLLARDLPALGALAERNAWRMHATAMAADPHIVYLRPTTLAVVQLVESLRASGVPAYFTLDAGPNPVILCLTSGASRITMRASAVPGVLRTVVAGPGKGVDQVERPVF